MEAEPGSIKTIEVHFTCRGRNYKAKLRVGKVDDSANPGVVQVLFDRRLKDEVIGESLDRVEYHSVENLVVEQPDVILEFCETPEEAEGHSGDCFCYRDQSRRWHCVCDRM